MRILSALIIALMLSPATLANDRDWPAAPWRPELTYVHKDYGTACHSYEKDYLSVFFDGRADFETPKAEFNRLDISPWPDDIPRSIRARLRKYDPADFDNDGSEEYLLILNLVGSGNGAEYANFQSLHLVRPDRFAELTGALRSLTSDKNRRVRKLDIAKAVEAFEFARFDPYNFEREQNSLPANQRRSLALSPNALVSNRYWFLERNGRIYFDFNNARRQALPDEKGNLAIFKAGLEPTVICKVDAYYKRPADGDVFTQDPALRTFFSSATKTAGEATCEGSSRSGSRFVASIMRDPATVLARPWSFPHTPHYHGRKEFGSEDGRRVIDLYRRLWAVDGAWNRRAYDNFNTSRRDARRALGKYFQSAFDVSRRQSEAWAENATSHIEYASTNRTSSYLLHQIANAFDEVSRVADNTADADDYVRTALTGKYFTKENELDRALRLAASNGATESVVDALIDRGALVDSGNESALMVAIDQPAMMRLLIERGADVERPNVFGKTPLMMAAHLNEKAAVRILLQEAADANARTLRRGAFLPEDSAQRKAMPMLCRYRIRFGERTALMYAAENASLDVTKMLLRAGADASAVDSGGRGVVDYLSRNQLLAPSEQARARALLVKNGAAQ